MNKQIEEMRYLADEMGKAISTEIKIRYLEDERKLEAVLKANGWHKQSEVVEKIFGEIYEVLNELYESANNACHNNMLYGNTDSPWGMRDFGVAIGIKKVGNAIRKIESKMKGDKTDA